MAPAVLLLPAIARRACVGTDFFVYQVAGLESVSCVLVCRLSLTGVCECVFEGIDSARREDFPWAIWHGLFLRQVRALEDGERSWICKSSQQLIQHVDKSQAQAERGCHRYEPRPRAHAACVTSWEAAAVSDNVHDWASSPRGRSGPATGCVICFSAPLRSTGWWPRPRTTTRILGTPGHGIALMRTKQCAATATVVI